MTPPPSPAHALRITITPVHGALLSLGLITLGGVPLPAQDIGQDMARGLPNSTPEQRLEQGLRDFHSYDVGQAFRRWFADSPLANDEAGQAKARDEMEKILASYGRIEDAEVIESRDLGKRVRRYYFVLHCERGPIYGSADAFASRRGWVLTDFQFHTKAAKVFPAAMLEP